MMGRSSTCQLCLFLGTIGGSHNVESATHTLCAFFSIVISPPTVCSLGLRRLSSSSMTERCVFLVESSEDEEDTLSSAVLLDSKYELLVALYSPNASPTSGTLAILEDRFVKLLVMLATLSFRITELADARTTSLLRGLDVMPGKGRISLDHTSCNRISSRTLSSREGDKTGMRLVLRSDCDRLIAIEQGEL